MKHLECSHVSVSIGHSLIVQDISFTLHEHDWLMMIGPNGTGKSTLLRAIACSRPSDGTILLDQVPLRAMKPAQRARRVGLLSQHTMITGSYTVREIVAMGRYSRSSFGKPEAGLSASVDSALSQVGLDSLQDRQINTLSGGEIQRMMLAQVLCQDPELLLLDEPSNHLDLDHQQQLYLLVDAWRRREGKAVISVVHDLSLARCFGTHVLLLENGVSLGFGSAADVMCDENLNRVWHMDVSSWIERLHQGWH